MGLAMMKHMLVEVALDGVGKDTAVGVDTGRSVEQHVLGEVPPIFVERAFGSLGEVVDGQLTRRSIRGRSSCSGRRGR